MSLFQKQTFTNTNTSFNNENAPKSEILTNTGNLPKNIQLAMNQLLNKKAVALKPDVFKNDASGMDFSKEGNLIITDVSLHYIGRLDDTSWVTYTDESGKQFVLFLQFNNHYHWFIRKHFKIIV